ncbi:MAG: hypothetical protein RIR51_63 [Bacteroidota bacterium]|jgi:1,4-dihydroxy-2-naphthoyl-CoA hydrolase
MFKVNRSIEELNEWCKGNMLEHLGIKFLEASPEYLKASMPVDHRTKQPFGLLHGGASVVLSETLGSVATAFAVEDYTKEVGVGVEINANHLKSVTSGTVIGICTPIRLGRKIQVFETKIYNEEEELICVSRLTCAIVPLRS